MKNKIIISLYILGFYLFCFNNTYAKDSKTRYMLESRYIFNFTKYIEWNNESKLEKFKIGVLCGDSAGLSLSKELKKISETKLIKGLPINTFNFKTIGEVGDVQILYVNRKGNYNIQDVMKKIEGTNTLLVTAPNEIIPDKYEGYSCENSMINFTIRNDKLEFEINRGRMAKQGLILNSSLLILAVADCNALNYTPPTAEEKEAALIDWENAFNELQKEILVSKQQVEILSTKKVKSLEEIEKLNTANQLKELKIRVQQDEYNKKIVEKEHALTLKEQEVNRRRMQIELMQRQKELKQAEFDKKMTESSAESKRQKLIIGFTISGMILLIIFTWFIFNRFRITQRQKKIITVQKEQLSEIHKNTMESISYAQLIQQALFTSEEYLTETLKEYFKVFIPRDVVSGDFYWCYKLNDGCFILATCDCTGHGVPGAFLSMLFNSLLDEVVIEQGITEPGKILNLLRDGIVKKIGRKGEQKDGMDCAMCIIDRKAEKMQFAGANNPCLIVETGGKVQLLLPDTMPVGYEENKMGKSFSTKETVLSAGSMIYTFTDGFRDQFGGIKNKKFGRQRFLDLLGSIASKTIIEQKEILEKTFYEWKGKGEQTDDVTVIGIRI